MSPVTRAFRTDATTESVAVLLVALVDIRSFHREPEHNFPEHRFTTDRLGSVFDGGARVFVRRDTASFDIEVIWQLIVLEAEALPVRLCDPFVVGGYH